MKKMKSESKLLIYEVISICLIYIAALAVRVKFINDSFGMLTGNLSIFDNATIKGSFTNEITTYSHGIVQVYAYILSWTCAFLGNKPIAVVCLQFLLQMFGIIFIFFTMRNLLGRISAFISIVTLAFLPFVFQQINIVNYENVLFTMLGIVFVVQSLFFRKSNFTKYKNPSWLFWVLILGVMTGLIIGLDISGILATLLGVALIIGQGKSESKFFIQNRIIVFFIYLVGSISGIFASIYGLAINKGISFIDCGIDTFHLYFTNITFLYQDRPIVLTIIILVFVTTIIQIIINCIWKLMKLPKMVVELQSTQEIGEVLMDEIMIDTIEELQVEDSPIMKPIKFIPNPLPVPKKHVKKELNYSFEIPEDKMIFDIDLLVENDDFDLK